MLSILSITISWTYVCIWLDEMQNDVTNKNKFKINTDKDA